MARSRRTVRRPTVNINTRNGRGTLRATYSGGQRQIYTHKGFPRLIGRVRLNLRGHRNGGWLNPRNW